MRKIQMGIYAAVHFLVDLGCVLLLLGQICPDWDPVAAVIFFCLFAFVFQMPIGLLADKIGQSHLFAAAGCLLVSAGWMMAPGLGAVAAAGLGNAAFHVGGGLFTLNEEKHKAGPLGLFVSPGAFGAYLGSKYAFSVQGWSVGMMLALAAILVILLCKGDENEPFAAPRGAARLWIWAGCLFVVVIMRSLLGLGADLHRNAEWGLAAVCAIAGGKAVGGYLADRFGMTLTACVSLGLSAVSFLAGSYSALNLAALFLFNMTVPLTLRAMADLFSGMKGFSFGLLTFGLFLGFLPVFFGWGGISFLA